MSVETLENSELCSKVDLAAYLDGELSSSGEAEVELHVAACSNCAYELNLQKRFLRVLESEVGMPSMLPLPDDFAKRIVVRAESNVSGLRNRNEQFSALFLTAAVALFCLFALGAEASGVLNGVTGFFDSSTSILMMVLRVVSSFFIGVSVVLRNIAVPFEGIGVSVLLPAVVSILAIIAVSRFYSKVRRV